MKILITGASGFIGTYIVKELLDHGYELYSLTRKKEYTIPGTKTFTGDITNFPSLQPAIENVDAVIHNAAYANDWGKRRTFYDINVTGTRNVAEACEENNINRLLYTSTAGIYGFPNNLDPIKESDGPTPKPLNDYGDTKILSENVLKEYSTLKTTIIRPPMVFGAGGKPTRILVSKVENGKAGYIGKGEKYISVVHPADVAQLFRLALDKEKEGAYNVVSFTCSIREMFEAISERLNIDPPEKRFPFFVAYLMGYLSELVARNEPSLTRFRVIKLGTSRIIDGTKAKKELGFIPNYDLDKTVEDMVSWYVNEDK